MGSQMGSAGLMLVNTLVNVYLFVLMLRFLLQFSRADYYNPVSQAVIKAPRPVVAPLQRIFRPRGRFDPATLVAGLLLKGITIFLLLKFAGITMPPLQGVLVAALAGVLSAILDIYFFALIIMIILSWVAPQANHPGAILVHQLVEPIMAPVRKVIPPLGMIDLSPIVVFIAISLFDSLIVGALARAAGLPGMLVGF